MADIELVIKLSEEDYKYIMGMQFCISGIRSGKGLLIRILHAIRTGAPLPKGHGDLVDRDAINERFDSIYNDAINCSNQPSDKYLLDKLSMCLDTALPIIEADKEDEN